MRPDDDIKLGKIVKFGGFRQDVVLGDSKVTIEWYASVPEMVRGLTKNLFAGADYSVLAILGGSLFLALAFVWPYATLFLASGAAFWVGLACVVMVSLLYLDVGRSHGIPPATALGIPASALLLIFIFWKSTLTTLWQGGITWRGTHYPLKELRKNRV
jgi:hypothetical protein